MAPNKQMHVGQIVWLNVIDFVETSGLRFNYKIKMGICREYYNGILKTHNEKHGSDTRYKGHFILKHKNSRSTYINIFQGSLRRI